MTKKLLINSLALLALVACSKDKDVINPGTTSSVPGDIRDIVAPASFKFNTSNDVDVNVNVKGLDDAPLSGIRIDFYDKDPIEGGVKFASAITSSNGNLSAEIKIPTYLKEVYVLCNYKGFANSKVVQVSSNMTADFGGIPAPRKFKKAKASSTTARIPAGGNVYYIGTFSSNGLPDYLENPGDVISSDLLDDINSSLPSNVNVPINSPQYLVSSNEFDIVIDAISDVWVTFIGEGAGYKNALGYFVYDTGNPPATPSDIDSVFVAFPNTSLQGSGGALQAGDKVSLGRFPAGKTISWVLFQNAYSSSGNSVNVNKQRIYSLADLNPEPSASQRQHTVQLVDNGRQLLINGFEDILRNNAGCDHDFEDLLFYVTANPWSGVETGNCPPVTPSADADNDGVNDVVDDYPNDPLRAIDVVYSGNLGYEDLWPSQGDYDFNDLVMGYEITHVLNSQNLVVDVKADWTIRAVGAGFNNGFGWAFKNISPTAVSSVNGTNTPGGIVNIGANGVESGQSKATVIVFDDVFNEIQPAGGSFINTIKGNPYVNPVTKSVTVNFSSPQNSADLGLPPYNAFIFVDGDRTKEVHLADNEPTDLADVNLLGTKSDDSNSGQGRYYKTKNNLPWAIHIYGDYDYPVEYISIDDAHLNFGQWAQGGGTSLEDWYLNLPGYRNLANIY